MARCVAPAVKLLLSQHATFPGGSVCRLALCHKLIDLMYVLGLRMGLEMTRRFLRQPMLLLMDAFSIVYDGLSDIVASHSEFPPPGEFLVSTAMFIVIDVCIVDLAVGLCLWPCVY